MVIIPATTPDVCEIISTTHAQEQHASKQKIIQNVAFLGRQGIAFEVMLKLKVILCNLFY